jgi:diketogulonate reductase-like aldo/keto reductase
MRKALLKKGVDAMQNNIHTTIPLNNQVEIPVLGLGTWQAEGNNCAHAVAFALTHGYDHIDTAQAYGNEDQVADGWQASGRDREDIFITTKIWNSNQGAKRSQRSVEKSLRRLKTDYLDLCLIHWPDADNFQRTLETWETLISLREAGTCRAIGVSNFTIPLLEQLIEASGKAPSINQVEFHPFLYQKNLLDYCRKKGIQLEAYSPLARAKHLDNPTLQSIGEKYGKTPAQVMLAWGLHHDLVLIPKSVHENRIEGNADIFFNLDEEDMQKLDSMEPQHRLIKPGWAPPSW